MGIFCCETFSAAVANAGKRGLSVILQRTSNDRVFLQQIRACDGGSEHALAEVAKRAAMRGRVMLVGQLAISYCPWCGRRLSLWIEGNTEAFDQHAAATGEWVIK